MDYTCKVCGNAANNIPYTVREMMFGRREKFVYIRCAVCGCLQLADIPANLSDYYPADYYSYHLPYNEKTWKQRLITGLVVMLLNLRLSPLRLTDYWAVFFSSYYKYPWMQKQWINKDASVIDIGCGNGALLYRMKQCGFKQLAGFDPYIEKTITYDNGVTVYKKDVFEIEGCFDFIMLHHSFEHMADPHRVFSHLHGLLSPRGFILIRIPVAGCYAWRKYGVDWFQIDAPRHLFVHSVQSICYLAERHGLELEHVFYDSTFKQLMISEKYRRNVAMNEEGASFSWLEKWKFKRKANELNALQDGDMACFLLKKTGRYISNIHTGFANGIQM